MARYCVVTTTARSRADAEELGRLAVGARLAACAQVSGPISSTYRWQGRVETAEEWVCSCKTTEVCTAPLVAAWRAAHAYDNPEIIATPIDAASDDYLAWLDAETAPGVQ